MDTSLSAGRRLDVYTADNGLATFHALIGGLTAGVRNTVTPGAIRVKAINPIVNIILWSVTEYTSCGIGVGVKAEDIDANMAWKLNMRL